jgi:hypothetical protein
MAIPVFPTVDRWKLRPHDQKCKKFVPFDSVVDDQIRCKVPLWSGDFDELKPELIAQGLRLDELPRLTVYDIGQFVIRAAQGGSLRCGPVGTAAHTVVSLLPPAEPTAAESEHARIARRLSIKARRVLWYMRENNACQLADSLTRQGIADELGLTIDDIRTAGEEIRRADKKLLDSQDGRGGGWWLWPDGFQVAEHCAPAAAVNQASARRA